jgi:hypothetical protein
MLVATYTPFTKLGYDLLLHVFQTSTKNHRKLEKKLSILKGLLCKNIISIFGYLQAKNARLMDGIM